VSEIVLYIFNAEPTDINTALIAAVVCIAYVKTMQTVKIVGQFVTLLIQSIARTC